MIISFGRMFISEAFIAAVLLVKVDSAALYHNNIINSNAYLAIYKNYEVDKRSGGEGDGGKIT